MNGAEKVETNFPVVLDVLVPSVRFPEENAFSACGLRGAPFQRLRLAVLIDGDNQAPAPVENFLKKLPAYGNVTMGRVFGNWSKPAFGAWSDFCRRTGFSARQQHDYVTGKNATDIALVIDAMELAFARNVEGFVLITADSDFTPLAVRLRELGFVVIGAAGPQRLPLRLLARNTIVSTRISPRSRAPNRCGTSGWSLRTDRPSRRSRRLTSLPLPGAESTRMKSPGA